MPIEFTILAFMSLFLFFAWLPASVAKKRSYGMKWLAGNRTPSERVLSEWGQRAERAHQNFKDYFPSFAVVVILLGLTQNFSPSTAIACGFFALFRVIHFIVYCLGYPMLRAFSFFMNLFAVCYLYGVLFYATL